MLGLLCLDCPFLNTGYFDEETNEWVDDFDCDRGANECPKKGEENDG